MDSPRETQAHAKAAVGSTAADGDAEGHVVVWNGGAMQDLNDLVQPLQPSVTLTTGVAINHHGQILVNGFDSTLHAEHAYLLSPAPPGTATATTADASQ
jgi:hypothetical protein